jgi:hypothetical protein
MLATLHPETIVRRQRIVDWANTHDTGAPVTAKLLNDGTIEIHGTAVARDGTVIDTVDTATTLDEVRAHLGY